MSSCEVNGKTKGNKPLLPGDTTRHAIAQLWEELTDIFQYGLVHIGGDEVKYECWDQDPTASAWMKAHGLSSEQTYFDFCKSTVTAVEALGRRAVMWNDVYRMDRHNRLPKSVVVQVWSPASDILSAVRTGYDVIAAPFGAWYVSQTQYSVSSVYQYDPCAKLALPALCNKVKC